MLFGWVMPDMLGKIGNWAVFSLILSVLVLMSGCVSREFSFGGEGTDEERAGPPHGKDLPKTGRGSQGENLTIAFISVGQGDAILLNKGNFSALIDGGKSGSGRAILGELNKTGDLSIELIVATHPDSDHIGGLSEVMKTSNFSIVWDSEVSEETKSYLEYSNLSKQGKISYPKAGDQFNYSGISFTVLNPQKGGQFGEKNENSIVVLVSYGEIDILLTGDCEGECEKALLESVPDIDILKVAHHGGKYSTGEAFLARARPEVSVISVGKNPYGHPTNETIGRLRAVGSEILRTDESGTIALSTDGRSVFLGRKTILN